MRRRSSISWCCSDAMLNSQSRKAFFDALLACCTAYPDACLTLTAIHPDGKHSTPSRHIPLDHPATLRDALTDLNKANAQGWGAYFAVGVRRPGLTRWQRGGAGDVIALPALFVDVDDPSGEALAKLQCAKPSPSCLVASGGGYHAYWWLDEPTTELHTARHLLRGLATACCAGWRPHWAAIPLASLKACVCREAGTPSRHAAMHCVIYWNCMNDATRSKPSMTICQALSFNVLVLPGQRTIRTSSPMLAWSCRSRAHSLRADASRAATG